MKKLILPALFIGAISFTSCKKEHTCECKVNGSVVSSGTIKDTKKNAKNQCESGNATAFGITITCELN